MNKAWTDMNDQEKLAASVTAMNKVLKDYAIIPRRKRISEEERRAAFEGSMQFCQRVALTRRGE